MVDDEGLAPFRTVRSWRLGGLANRRIEQQVIKFTLAEPVERLPSKRLDRLQIRELEGKNGQAVLGGVVTQAVVRRPSAVRVPGAKDHLVPLGGLSQEQLLDGLKALGPRSDCAVSVAGHGCLTRPDETPVATIVFVTVAMIAVSVFKRT